MIDYFAITNFVERIAALKTLNEGSMLPLKKKYALLLRM